jgi:hypothetical protein
MPRQMRNEHSALSAVLHMLGRCTVSKHWNALQSSSHARGNFALGTAVVFTSSSCLLLPHNDTPVLQSKAKEADASVYTISAVTFMFLTQ